MPDRAIVSAGCSKAALVLRLVGLHDFEKIGPVRFAGSIFPAMAHGGLAIGGDGAEAKESAGMIAFEPSGISTLSRRSSRH
jgi:hypothetical protein